MREKYISLLNPLFNPTKVIQQSPYPLSPWRIKDTAFSSGNEAYRLIFSIYIFILIQWK